MAKTKVAKKSASSSKQPKKAASAVAKKAKSKMTAAKPVKMMAKKSQEAEDIIDMILEDHKALKKLIKVMKETDHEIEERRNAFDEFAPLLTLHAKPEERTMYVAMKEDEELREEGFEGDVEHSLADQLAEEIKRTDDEDLWSARVKVLAELVEHHIEEEEEDLLPDFRKHSEKQDRVNLGQEFIRLKEELLEMGGSDTVEESEEIDVEEETEEFSASHS